MGPVKVTGNADGRVLSDNAQIDEARELALNVHLATGESITFEDIETGEQQTLHETSASDKLDGKVSDVEGEVAKVATVEELDALEAQESEGKDRKGVLDAIAARREELEAA